MSNFGVVTYKEAVQAISVELKTASNGGFEAMTTNPMFLTNKTMLQGRALQDGVSNIAIYLNGELSNNLFSIDKGLGYITFLYQGSTNFLKGEFLIEVNLF